MILVVDFGSQTTHLIARRLKELGTQTTIIPPRKAITFIRKEKPQGIVLSGGPSSVYEKNAPSIDKAIFDQNIPILGICYGLQLTAHLLGGKVVPGKKEYGPAKIILKSEARNPKSETNSNNQNTKGFEFRYSNFEITNGLSKTFVVWMSHGDEVVRLPQGFQTIGSTDHVPFAFAHDTKRQIFGLQFHPEVEHTEWGSTILKNFVNICSNSVILGRTQSGAWRTTPESLRKIQDEGDSGPNFAKATMGKQAPLQRDPDPDVVEDARYHRHIIGARMTMEIEKIIHDIKNKVGKESYVIGAVSGGVDSTVAGVLTAKAIGKRFIPVFVDNGLMREGTEESVKKIFTEYDIKPIVVKCGKEMLRRLAGIKSPERKRKLIGRFYIELFEEQMYKTISARKKVEWLLQGTIYSDVIESKGSKHAAKIKSHHNVGGLPRQMKLKLLEPLREFYKDEVRSIGTQLGLLNEFVWKQTFPGPGYAIRIRGQVTHERLEKEKLADKIVLEELQKADLLKDVYMSFPIMTGASSTAVKGDGRFFGEVVCVRVVQSKDVMTSTWARLPYQVLQEISSRIVNEVPGISRVVYDISTKPPATMEWE